MQLPKSRKSAPAALAVAASKPEDKCERTRLHQTGSQRKSPDAPDFTDCTRLLGLLTFVDQNSRTSLLFRRSAHYICQDAIH